MGSVWVAHDHRTARDVAVKVMAPELAADPTLEARFEREARAGAKIQSPHVVSLLSHGVTAGGLLYIVMELGEGETLRARLDRLGALPLREVAHILHGLCEALTAAHLHGIVHRDIKPDNILVGTDSRVRVFDFGIAKQPRASDEESLTQANVVLGSLAYMSREQLLSPRQAAPSFDTWAAAVVAYEALSAKLPFPGKSFGQLLKLLVSGRFEPLSQLGLPPDVDPIFERAFATDPTDRFDEPRQLAAALRQVAR
jgi:serine/threonine-protein kinase